MAIPYAQKLKDPRWQRKRLEALSDAEFSCSICGDADSTLHVHHRAYFKGREPWEYDVGQLQVVCESCHAGAHEGEDVFSLVGSYLPSGAPLGREELACALLAFIPNDALGPGSIDKLAAMGAGFWSHSLAYTGALWSVLHWALNGIRDPNDLLRLVEGIQSDRAPLARMVAEYLGGLPQEVDHYQPLHKALGGEPRS
jgi:hypothetical protein